MEGKMQLRGRGFSSSTRQDTHSTNSRPITEQPQQPRGRGVVRRPTVSACICHRPKKLLLCGACGYTISGRVRKPCSVHPNTIFLMDLDQCPGCLAYSFMIKEYSDEEET